MGSLENERNKLEEGVEEEPILMEQNQRFCMFPIRYKQLWEMYKKAQASFWTGTCPSSFLTVLFVLLFVSCSLNFVFLLFVFCLFMFVLYMGTFVL